MPDQRPASIRGRGGVGGDIAAGDRHGGEGDVRGGKTTLIQRIFSPRKKLDQRNRRILLDKVQNFWVEGVLEKSLHGAAMIAPGMEKQSGEVDHPWEMVLEMPAQEKTYTLPSGTRIADVFDGVGRALLILGEPGSGKTTTLLELARDLIAHARDNIDEPVPVVFNLSSWDGQGTIARWLAGELNTKYGIPKKLGREWLAEEWLLLLLDGLDEVREEHRTACVEAINWYREGHSQTPLAVCSRTADYRALTAPLKLEGVVVLQPLSREQIAAYLECPGDELRALRTLLHSDGTWLELAQNPLVLSMMVLAYGGASLTNLPAFDTVEARRKHLFNAYVRRMFMRGKREVSYTPKQTAEWLVWLARKMVERSQTVFLIERMQPGWLDTNAQRWLYRIITVLACVLIFGLLGGSLGVLVSGLVSGLIFGLIFGWGRKIKTVEAWGWSWRRALRRLLTVGLPGGLVIWLISELLGSFLAALAFMLTSLLDVLLVVTILFVFVGLVDPFAAFYFVEDAVAKAGLTAGLAFGLLAGLFGGLGRRQVEARSMVVNQGIWLSARRTLIAGLIFGLAAGLAAGLVAGQNVGVDEGLLVGLLGGVVGGLIVLLLYGGKAIIQHLTLRAILASSGRLPWKLVPFLNHAADLTILRKVGGGYIFVHRLLMEHFATIDVS
jgi:DNA polymerase III delta prime subunit